MGGFWWKWDIFQCRETGDLQGKEMWFVDDFLETADHESEAKWNKYQTSQPYSNELQFLLAPFGSPEQFQKPRRRFVLRNAATSRNIRPQHSNLLIAYSRAEISTSGASVWKAPIPIPYVCSRPQGINNSIVVVQPDLGLRKEKGRVYSGWQISSVFESHIHAAATYEYYSDTIRSFFQESMRVFVVTVPMTRSAEQRCMFPICDEQFFFDLSRTCFLETHGNTILACENWEEDFASHQLRFEERVKRLLNFFSFVWCLKRNIRDLNQRMAVRIGSSDLVDHRISIKIASQVTDWQDHRCKSDKLFKENVCYKCGSRWRCKKEFCSGLRGQTRFHKPGTKTVRDVEFRDEGTWDWQKIYWCHWRESRLQQWVGIWCANFGLWGWQSNSIPTTLHRWFMKKEWMSSNKSS